MKKTLRLLALLVAVIALPGCPYLSDYPIDTPSVKVNPSWYGRYADENGQTNFSYVASTITISNKSEFEYKVDNVYYTTDSMGVETENVDSYSAYVSMVKGKSFINVQKQDEYTFYIYKVDVSKEKNIVLTELTDGWKGKVNDSKELKAFLGKHIKNELLYGETVTLKRK